MNTTAPLPPRTPDFHAPIENPSPDSARRVWPVWARLLLLFGALIGATFALAGVQLLLGLVVRSPGARESLSNGTLGLVLAPLMYAVPLAVAVLAVRWVMRRREDRSPREAGLVFSAWSIPLLLFGIAISVAVTVPVAWWLEQQGMLRDYPTLASTWGELVRTMPVWLGLAFILQGFPEELIFRGWMMQAMRTRPWRAWMASSLAFGVIHVLSSGGQQNMAERVLYVVHALAFGAAAGALLMALRSLWVAVGIHGGLHVAYALFGPLGIGGGPAEWAATSLLYLLVAGIALLAWHRSGASEIVIDR